MEAVSAVPVERSGRAEETAVDGRVRRAGDELAPERWRELFARLAAGGREALGELYELASGRLYGLALWRTGDPADAEEVVQEVFVTAWKRRSDLEAVDNPRAWLFSVAANLARDEARTTIEGSGQLPLEQGG